MPLLRVLMKLHNTQSYENESSKSVIEFRKLKFSETFDSKLYVLLENSSSAQ